MNDYDVYYEYPGLPLGNEETLWVDDGDGGEIALDVCHFRVRARSPGEAEDKGYSILTNYAREDRAYRPGKYTIVRVRQISRKEATMISDIKQYRSLGFSNDEIKELLAKQAELAAKNRRKAKPKPPPDPLPKMTAKMLAKFTKRLIKHSETFGRSAEQMAKYLATEEMKELLAKQAETLAQRQLVRHNEEKDEP